MRDAAGDPAALELLRMQQHRLADRMRPPWWYPTGSAILGAVLFAGPFVLRYFLHGVPRWPSLIGTAAALCLLRHGLLAAAIIVAALAVAVQVTLLRARLRGVRQELRVGGAAA